jgi:hypothetical protein
MKAAFIGLIFPLSTFVCAAAQFRTTAEFIYQTNGIKEHRDEAWSAKRPILEVGEDVTWNWGTVSTLPEWTRNILPVVYSTNANWIP